MALQPLFHPVLQRAEESEQFCFDYKNLNKSVHGDLNYAHLNKLHGGHFFSEISTTEVAAMRRACLGRHELQENINMLS